MTKWILCLPFVLACSKSSSSSPPAPAVSTHVEIAVTEKGFEPADVAVPAGKPVTIVFDRKTDQTCAKAIVVDTGDGKKIEKELPLNQPVEIAATVAKPGKLGYACAMDMRTGTISGQ